MDPQNPPGSSGGGATLGASWKFDNGTADADPGNRNFRFNNADPTLATFIYVSDTTNDGVDASNILSLLNTGELYVQQQNDSSRANLFALNGATVDGGGYWKLPVVHQSPGDSSSYQNNQVCGFIFYTPVDGGLNAVVDDTSPQLGGDLDVNGHQITAQSGVDVEIKQGGGGGGFVVYKSNDDEAFEVDSNGTVKIGPDDAGQDIIQRSSADGSLAISGGSGGAGGGQIRLYGPSHASVADDIAFLSAGSEKFKYDASDAEMDFNVPLNISNANAGQIRFPGTQNPSADANTLDDYDEGNFTPKIQDFSFSDGEGQTYAVQVGEYTKIGNTVFFKGHIEMSSIGTLSGHIFLVGLPFSSSAVTDSYSAMHMGAAAGLNISAGENLAGWVFTNNSVAALTLWDVATGSSPLDVSELSSNGSFSFAGYYTV